MAKGRSLNLLGLPKKESFMRCFVAPPGTTLLSCDISALEPNVLAFMSKDPTLYKVYGPDAWPHHDIYFIAGMSIPGIKERILPHYNLDNPTIEGVKLLKNTENDIRKKVLKPAYLGFLYGLGAKTLSINLDISFFEAKKILNGISRQFPGKDHLNAYLLSKWADNGGYLINGRGMPICVDPSKKKDIVNRCVQSTGHQILQRMLWHTNRYRKENNIQMRPYIPDFYDEQVWAVQLGSEQQAAEAVNYGFFMINQELGWDIQIRHGGIDFGNDLRIRCEDFKEKMTL